MYIGSIYVQHKDSLIKLFDAGKPVLCEKPLSTGIADTSAVIQAAPRKRTFLDGGRVCSSISTKLRGLT